jgi:hypothetical protein
VIEHVEAFFSSALEEAGIDWQQLHVVFAMDYNPRAPLNAYRIPSQAFSPQSGSCMDWVTRLCQLMEDPNNTAPPRVFEHKSSTKCRPGSTKTTTHDIGQDNMPLRKRLAARMIELKERVVNGLDDLEDHQLHGIFVPNLDRSICPSTQEWHDSLSACSEEAAQVLLFVCLLCLILSFLTFS